MNVENPVTNYRFAPTGVGNAAGSAFSKNTAGNLMKTGYAVVRPNQAAADAIKTLHHISGKRHQNGGRMFYVYVTDDDNRLLGVFSLNNLISACPGIVVSDFMKTELITVGPATDQSDVAQTIARHNLLAVPVVDEQNHLLGIVTADDALEQIIPPDWKDRLPRFYR
jgi:Mg/Co/Ni transporter MgtE